jgi:hypothetical protein
VLLRHHHCYAIDIHNDLPDPTENPFWTVDRYPDCLADSPNNDHAPQSRPISIGFESGDQLRSFTTPIPHVLLPVSLTRPGPSDSAEPS